MGSVIVIWGWLWALGLLEFPIWDLELGIRNLNLAIWCLRFGKGDVGDPKSEIRNQEFEVRMPTPIPRWL